MDAKRLAEQSKGRRGAAKGEPDAPAPATTDADSGTPGPVVVGIGTSAGGLDALRKFFGAMPHDCGMAFVIIQHLNPAHESLMTGLLAGLTAM